MPTVTVTFQEEGQDPASFVIAPYAVAAIQQYVDANPELYTGKADLFRKVCMEQIVAPLCQRYDSYPETVVPALAALQSAKATAETAIAAAIAAAIETPTP